MKSNRRPLGHCSAHRLLQRIQRNKSKSNDKLNSKTILTKLSCAFKLDKTLRKYCIYDHLQEYLGAQQNREDRYLAWDISNSIICCIAQGRAFEASLLHFRCLKKYHDSKLVLILQFLKCKRKNQSATKFGHLLRRQVGFLKGIQ